MDIKVGASILSADFSNLKGELKKCEDAGVDIIHLDIMDGHFVPNLTFGPVVVEAVRKHTRLPLDAHLMIRNPSRYIPEFLRAGVDIITVHAECYPWAGSANEKLSGEEKELLANLERTSVIKYVQRVDLAKLKRDLGIIKGADVKAAVSLNPGTPLCFDAQLLAEMDMVLIMSVNPGFSGQKFMEAVVPKIRQLHAIYKGDIAVDGGINDKTAPLVVKAGANILVTASYFFSSPNHKKAVATLKSMG
ncbi:MAG: ribulose-phosphate 3-epimerase [Planctomycetes bacterium]|nr:ribulose-phosphate 3-epimerase [Planctomycetota bacterium]